MCKKIWLLLMLFFIGLNTIQCAKVEKSDKTISILADGIINGKLKSYSNFTKNDIVRLIKNIKARELEESFKAEQKKQVLSDLMAELIKINAKQKEENLAKSRILLSEMYPRNEIKTTNYAFFINEGEDSKSVLILDIAALIAQKASVIIVSQPLLHQLIKLFGNFEKTEGGKFRTYLSNFDIAKNNYLRAGKDDLNLRMLQGKLIRAYSPFENMSEQLYFWLAMKSFSDDWVVYENKKLESSRSTSDLYILVPKGSNESLIKSRIINVRDLGLDEAYLQKVNNLNKNKFRKFDDAANFDQEIVNLVAKIVTKSSDGDKEMRFAYWSGHGHYPNFVFPGGLIGGLSNFSAMRLLSILEERSVSFLYISTCFSGGMQRETISDFLARSPIHKMIVASQGVAEMPTLMFNLNPSYNVVDLIATLKHEDDKVGLELLPISFYSNFHLFYECLKNYFSLGGHFKTGRFGTGLRAAVKSLGLNEQVVEEIPFVRFGGIAELFSVLDFDNKICLLSDVLGSIKFLEYKLNATPFIVKDKSYLIVYPHVVNFPLKLQGSYPCIVSAVGRESFHFIREIECVRHNLRAKDDTLKIAVLMQKLFFPLTFFNNEVHFDKKYMVDSILINSVLYQNVYVSVKNKKIFFTRADDESMWLLDGDTLKEITDVEEKIGVKNEYKYACEIAKSQADGLSLYDRDAVINFIKSKSAGFIEYFLRDRHDLISTKNDTGQNLLTQCILAQRSAVSLNISSAKALLKLGIPFNEKDMFGKNSLDYMNEFVGASNWDSEIKPFVEKLQLWEAVLFYGEMDRLSDDLFKDDDMLSLGATLCMVDDEMLTILSALCYVIVRDLYDVAKELIEHGANVNSINFFKKSKLTSLHNVAMRGSNGLKFVKLLLDNNASCKIKDENGFTPLQCAVLYGSTVETLREFYHYSPEEFKQKSELGSSLLHLAAKRKNLTEDDLRVTEEVIKFLIRCGVDKAIPNNDGKVPCDLASDEEVRELLGVE